MAGDVVGVRAGGSAGAGCVPQLAVASRSSKTIQNRYCPAYLRVGFTRYIGDLAGNLPKAIDTKQKVITPRCAIYTGKRLQTILRRLDIGT